MKIEIPTDGYNIILSDNDLNNPNFVEMWIEEVKDKFDESDKEMETFPQFEPIMVPVDDLLRAISIFKKYEDI